MSLLTPTPLSTPTLDDLEYSGIETISVPRRFNGPRHSGNGGYSSGLVASLIDGPAEVRLRSPVPLDTPLRVERRIEGEVLVRNGDTLVASARPALELEVEVPPVVRFEEARRATEHFHGSGYDLLSQCYVCGPDRDDTFEVHTGPVRGRAVVASTWTPPCWAAGRGGVMHDEHVWAALDCPTYFGAYFAERKAMAMLAQMQARIDAPIVADTEYVVMAWPIETDGRKRWAGSAIVSPDGEILAVAKALLIELGPAVAG